MRIEIKRDWRGGEGRRLDILMLEKVEQCTYRMVANGSVGGGRRGGRRCHGAIKIGTIIIQEGQLTAGGGEVDDMWREMFWFLKVWNQYNSRRIANGRGWGS